MVPVFSLSTHARYACRHSGACCTSGWPIPVERGTSRRLRASLCNGELVAAGSSPLLVTHPDAPAETPVTAGVDGTGACVFYERDRRRCAIHRQIGEEALPVACRQFPRISLLDARGLFVTLSHYCPTAAAGLFEDAPLSVVEMPPAFPTDFGYDALDARSALPPLLHPTALLDLSTFTTWERAAVALLADGGRTAADALAAVAMMTEALRRWTPDGPDPEELLERATREARESCGGAGAAFDLDRAADHLDLVRNAVPDAWRPAAGDVRQAAERWLDDGWNGYAEVVRRYVAAKVFGSWLAYQGRGLRTIVFSAAVALSMLQILVSVECERTQAVLDRSTLITAIRQADEILLHLAGRQALADRLSRIEAADGTRLQTSIGCRLP